MTDPAAPQCRVCEDPLPAPNPAGGRPFRYCSEKCRRIAERAAERRCGATTRRGSLCENGVAIGQRYCALHAGTVPTERTCPTCKTRWHKKFPREVAGVPNVMSRASYAWLENLARNFDADGDELFTAEEFIAWAKPDLLGRPFIGETVGSGREEFPPYVELGIRKTA